MVRRTSTVRRRGLTADKLYELLTGEIRYPVKPESYSGYGAFSAAGDDLAEHYISDAMRQDWKENREALLAFWRSGEYTMTDTLAEFGLKVRIPPWIFVRGAPRTLPWAAKQFDQATPRRRLKKVRAA